MLCFPDISTLVFSLEQFGKLHLYKQYKAFVCFLYLIPLEF